MKKTENLVTVPSYIDSEEFVFTVPNKLEELFLSDSYEAARKARRDYRRFHDSAPYFEIWPLEKGVEHRMNSWVLKLHDTLVDWNNRPARIIRPFDGNPEEWFLWDSGLRHGQNVTLKPIGGKSYNERLKEALLRENAREHSPEGTEISKKIRPAIQLPPEELLKKLYKMSYGSLRTDLSHLRNFEFEDRLNQIKMDIRWYRSELSKLQRKAKLGQKKKQAAKMGLSVAELHEQKRQEEEKAKKVQFTNDWLKVSKDVHRSIEFLTSVVEHMGNRKKMDRDWFDKNRRELRELANTMRDIGRHFPKKKKEKK